jgi:hypothetical protein
MSMHVCIAIQKNSKYVLGIIINKSLYYTYLWLSILLLLLLIIGIINNNYKSAIISLQSARYI